jgi:ketosteroid isomerase-like protein
MSANRIAVVQGFLQNTTNLKVVQQLATPDVTYVSLSFDNPELKKVIQTYWKTLDFKVTDAIEQGDRVAMFGSFTFKSNVTGREITSPFALLVRFEGDKIAYLQFLEDSYGTAGSFKTGGTTRFHSDPSGKEVEI